MKPLPAFVPVFIATLLAAAPAAAQGAWSVSLLPGISVGGAGDTQWSLLGATYRQVNPVAALGLEAGICGWDGAGGDGDLRNTASFTLEGGSDSRSRLEHVSVSMRLLADGFNARSGPYAFLSLGGYRQDVRDRTIGPILGDPRYGKVRPGGAFGFGACGRRGVKPGAEMRVEWIATQPQSTVHFTSAMGLHANW